MVAHGGLVYAVFVFPKTPLFTDPELDGVMGVKGSAFDIVRFQRSIQLP